MSNKPINSTEKTTNKPNATQVKQTEPVVSVAVDKTVLGVAGNRPVTLNVPDKNIGYEIQKNNLAQLETLYVEEQKHLGEVH